MRFTEPCRPRRAVLAALAAAALLAACGTPPTGLRPGEAGGRAGGGPAPELPPPAGRARNWDDYKLQAARRLVAANPEVTHMGEVVQPLLAIPVLEIELNADGSVRHIKVSRYPGQARDTVDIAIAAVKRAAPFGDVRHLPKPWVYSEVFLFNDDRRFKPRLLDD